MLDLDLRFSVDFRSGEYICSYCHRRFPCFVWKKAPSHMRRTMSRKLSGTA